MEEFGLPEIEKKEGGTFYDIFKVIFEEINETIRLYHLEIK